MSLTALVDFSWPS
uniref:Uncharacterized protein n=1 Tax=Anguilla anguilla TaxID=7936 RepID=A0A0E9SW90_ANGAN